MHPHPSESYNIFLKNAPIFTFFFHLLCFRQYDTVRTQFSVLLTQFSIVRVLGTEAFSSSHWVRDRVTLDRSQSITGITRLWTLGGNQIIYTQAQDEDRAAMAQVVHWVIHTSEGWWIDP